jgi:hypothetical protein
MFSRYPSRLFDTTLEGRGFYAAGPAGSKSEAETGDLPAEGTGNTQRSDQSRDGKEGEPEREVRPGDHHSRRSDGVEELKRMEENAEDGRE